MKTKIIRQGDVLLRPISELPKNLTPVPREHGRVILAHGEVSGHAHALTEKHASLYTDDSGMTVLEIAEAMANLVHDEHATIPLQPGFYKVIRQREYKAKEIRRVAD